MASRQLQPKLKFKLNSPLLPCQPPLWARGAHAQTVLAYFLPSPMIDEPGERIEIPVSGGDRLIAHHFAGDSGMVVYLFHGLGGESHGSYMQRTALIARRSGHAVFLVNHRGCGDGRGLACEPYHSGRAEDLAAVIARGRQMYPNATHLGIGFSLSAAALLLLSAGVRGDVLPDGAIAVNAPINLARSARRLRRGLNRLYDLSFMGNMREAVSSRIAAGHPIPNPKLRWNSTLFEFDKLYTATAGGFASRADYYESCSAVRYADQIKIPTVVLTAADDPFIDVKDYREARFSPHVHLHIEPTGGHMGYLTKPETLSGRWRWLDYALENFIEGFYRPE